VLDARRAVQVVPLDTAVRLELSASEQAWK
jgi:hypothetical protein